MEAIGRATGDEPRNGPWVRVFATVWLGCACALSLGADKPTAPTEYEVKAAFLMNFTKFVDWPESAFADASAPLTICVLGDDPFGAALDQVVEGEAAVGRKITVRRIRRPPPPRACQVLFISKSEKDSAAIVAIAGPGVLTVGDRESFLGDGGIIAFVLQSRHIRFDINLQAAARASLGISARLLSVARTVQR